MSHIKETHREGGLLSGMFFGRNDLIDSTPLTLLQQQARHVQKRTRVSDAVALLTAQLAFGPMSGGWHHD